MNDNSLTKNLGECTSISVLSLCLMLLAPIALFAHGDTGKTEVTMSFEEKVSYVISHQEEQTKIMTEFKQQPSASDKSATPQDPSWKTKLKKPEMMSFDPNTDYFWILETNKGAITIKLWPKVAPMHVTSTIFLTEKGFYDNLTFHRVIPGFMAQGGCPLGTGTGGPGYQYSGECDPKVKHDRPYLLSMANAGPGTDGSQFFLTFAATPWLDGKHTLFGEIITGQAVMKILEAAGTPSGAPKEKLVINKAKIEKKPKV